MVTLDPKVENCYFQRDKQRHRKFTPCYMDIGLNIQRFNHNLFYDSSTAARYIPLLLDEGMTESVEQTVDPSNDGVNQLAKKLLDAVTDFKRL